MNFHPFIFFRFQPDGFIRQKDNDQKTTTKRQRTFWSWTIANKASFCKWILYAAIPDQQHGCNYSNGFFATCGKRHSSVVFIPQKWPKYSPRTSSINLPQSLESIQKRKKHFCILSRAICCQCTTVSSLQRTHSSHQSSITTTEMSATIPYDQF